MVETNSQERVLEEQVPSVESRALKEVKIYTIEGHYGQDPTKWYISQHVALSSEELAKYQEHKWNVKILQGYSLSVEDSIGLLNFNLADIKLIKQENLADYLKLIKTRYRVPGTAYSNDYLKLMNKLQVLMYGNRK